MSWLIENSGTIVVGIILLCIIAGIVYSMIKDKKAGKSLQCGAECKHCGGHCSYKSDISK